LHRDSRGILTKVYRVLADRRDGLTKDCRHNDRRGDLIKDYHPKGRDSRRGPIKGCRQLRIKDCRRNLHRNRRNPASRRNRFRRLPSPSNGGSIKD
jgi:hypothetical protein